MSMHARSIAGPIIVDASVALKWVLPAERSDHADRLSERESLHAPDLMLIESANALWLKVRRGTMLPAAAKLALADLVRAPITFTRDGLLADFAHGLSVDLDHPAYDCLYLALAINIAGTVVTDDVRFARAVRNHAYLADRIQLLAEC
jgi:predicted nucleic acid-binding protein